MTDIGQVQADEVFIIAFNAIFGHVRLLCTVPARAVSSGEKPAPSGECAHDTDAVKPANLALPRTTGRKPIAEGRGFAPPRGGPWWLAVLLLALCAGAVWGIVTA